MQHFSNSKWHSGMIHGQKWFCKPQNQPWVSYKMLWFLRKFYVSANGFWTPFERHLNAIWTPSNGYPWERFLTTLMSQGGTGFNVPAIMFLRPGYGKFTSLRCPNGFLRPRTVCSGKFAHEDQKNTFLAKFGLYEHYELTKRELQIILTIVEGIPNNYTHI